MGQLSDWLGGTYTLQGNSMASRKAVNMYLQSGEGLAKYSNVMIGTPGTQLLKDLSSDVGSDTVGCRGLWLTGASPYADGSLYWAFGSKIGYTYKDPLTGVLSSVVLYDIGLDTKRVSITDNGFAVIFATGTAMITAEIFTNYTRGTTADTVTDITSTLPFTQPLQVVYLMGRVYAISGDQNTTAKKDLSLAVKSNLIWYSALGDEKTWDALSFVPADLKSDPITSIVVRQGDLWAFGPSSYQIFNTGTNSDDPLQYSPGSGTLIGLNAPNSACGIGDSIFWMGSNAAGFNVIYRGVGFNAVRISTHGIESILTEQASLTSGAYGFAYQDSGHTFYCLTIPGGSYTFEGSVRFSNGVTIVYDVLTQQWHERASRDYLTGTQKAWQPLFSSFAWGKIVVGNLLFPAIMELRNDVYTDYDPTTADKKKPISRIFQGPVFFDNLQNFIIDSFTWDIVTGHGPLNGLSANPSAQLQISFDGGNTWGSIITQSLQQTGQYVSVVKWNSLGMGRAFVLRVTISEDLQFMAGQCRIRTRASTYE